MTITPEMGIILRPRNISKPSTQDVLDAMTILKAAGLPQTTKNIKIALEELYRAFKDQANQNRRET